MMDPMVTSGISSPNIARFMSMYLRETEEINVTCVSEMAELLVRDINGIDTKRYESPLAFMTPLAISPTTGSRSTIAHYIRSVIDSGYPLTLSLHSLATKVILDDSGDKPNAVGVDYMVGQGLYSVDSKYNASQTGELRTVKAKKEVIVAGSTFNTPQILKLRGIGPRAELEELGIPVIVDLPAVVSYLEGAKITYDCAYLNLQGNYMQDNYESHLHVRAEIPWAVPTNTSCTRRFDQSDLCFLLSGKPTERFYTPCSVGLFSPRTAAASAGTTIPTFSS
jgi:choline dehydrogenase